MKNLKELNEDLKEAARRLQTSNKNLYQLRDELLERPENKPQPEGERKEPSNLIGQIEQSLREVQDRVAENTTLSSQLLGLITDTNIDTGAVTGSQERGEWIGKSRI